MLESENNISLGALTEAVGIPETALRGSWLAPFPWNYVQPVSVQPLEF